MSRARFLCAAVIAACLFVPFGQDSGTQDARGLSRKGATAVFILSPKERVERTVKGIEKLIAPEPVTKRVYALTGNADPRLEVGATGFTEIRNGGPK